MGLIKTKKKNDISFIFYENEKFPRYQRIGKAAYSFLIYGPAALTIISIVISLSSLYYARTVESQIRSTEPEIIRDLRNDNSLLTSRVKELNVINENLTNKLSAGVSDKSHLSSIFAPVPGQKDLTSPIMIEINDFQVTKLDSQAKVTFNVVNITSTNEKIAGYAHLIASNGDLFERFPKSKKEVPSYQIIYSSGESFATSRFRPFEAVFDKVTSGTVIYQLVIFSRLGDIIHKQLFKLDIQ